MEEPDGPDDQHGLGPILGVLFVIGLVLGAIFLIERLKISSAQTDCIVTRDPRCRSLVE